MKETVNIKINQLPSKTWHWLKLNETNFAWTDEVQGCTIVKKESTENEALSGGKETAEALADIKTFKAVETGAGRQADCVFKAVAPERITAAAGREPVSYTHLAYWYDNGVLARSKEVYDPQTDAWYWFEADGTMARDKDVFIVLNADGTGKWTRYDSDGRMVKGESYKNGAWYYFDLTTGAMAKGFVNLPQSDDPNGKWVYYDPITGKMQYGEQYIDGYWYYFDTATGKMAHGITNIPDNDDAGGKWVYYDSITGRMQYGEQYIDGNRYYFDTVTGKKMCIRDRYQIH